MLGLDGKSCCIMGPSAHTWWDTLNSRFTEETPARICLKLPVAAEPLGLGVPSSYSAKNESPGSPRKG